MPFVLIHDLLKITLTNGGTYALDMASAQYGHYYPIVPWQDCSEMRIEEVVRCEPFGSWKALFENAETTEAAWYIYANRRTHAIYNGIFNLILPSYGKKIAIPEMLRIYNPKSFRHEQENFISFVEHIFKVSKQVFEMVTELRRQGIPITPETIADMAQKLV